MSDRRSWVRAGRTTVIIVLAALAAMWIYVLFIANPESTADKLHDGTFPNAAQPVCQHTLDDLKHLGVVDKVATTPQERGTLVDTADARLQKMVQQLRTIAPSNADDAAAVGKWLDDWDQWLRDRATWSEKLHRGEDAPFLEKQRANGDPNSKALDAFATTNDMGACRTPLGI